MKADDLNTLQHFSQTQKLNSQISMTMMIHCFRYMSAIRWLQKLKGSNSHDWNCCSGCFSAVISVGSAFNLELKVTLNAKEEEEENTKNKNDLSQTWNKAMLSKAFTWTAAVWSATGASWTYWTWMSGGSAEPSTVVVAPSADATAISWAPRSTWVTGRTECQLY